MDNFGTIVLNYVQKDGELDNMRKKIIIILIVLVLIILLSSRIFNSGGFKNVPVNKDINRYLNTVMKDYGWEEEFNFYMNSNDPLGNWTWEEVVEASESAGLIRFREFKSKQELLSNTSNYEYYQSFFESVVNETELTLKLHVFLKGKASSEVIGGYIEVWKSKESTKMLFPLNTTIEEIYRNLD